MLKVIRSKRDCADGYGVQQDRIRARTELCGTALRALVALHYGPAHAQCGEGCCLYVLPFQALTGVDTDT